MYPWLEAVQRQFSQQLECGRLAHACLLTGPADLGKQDMAMGWAAVLLCNEPGESACGHCRSCTLFAGGAHPDFRDITFERDKNDKLRTVIRVSQAREITAVLQLTTSISRRKVALIHPAEAMNDATANALLKTLEEPPGDAVLILVADNPSRLPATVRSRCQEFQVRSPPAAATREWLAQQVTCEPALLDLALRGAGGSPLAALRLIESDQISQFRQTEQTLQALERQRVSAGEALVTLSALAPAALWRWLSLLAAARVRHYSGMPAEAASAPGSTGSTAGANPASAADYARLQLLADRNRQLLATSVRKDLLLRDWLIQWSGLPTRQGRAQMNSR